MGAVLIIDDSAFQRKLIRDAVSAEGHSTLEAFDGAHGLEMAETYRPDCIISDILMPKMTGLELFERLRSRGLKIPVIALTADIQETTRRRCEDFGVVRFLNKPLKKADLVDSLSLVFAGSEEASE